MTYRAIALHGWEFFLLGSLRSLEWSVCIALHGIELWGELGRCHMGYAYHEWNWKSSYRHGFEF
jgi:hypothetical protein